MKNMHNITKRVLNFIDNSGMLRDVETALICVSGGADSMVLLHIMRELSKMRAFDVAAAHFNHNLRGEESDRDENFVMDFCHSEKIPIYTGRGDVRGYAKLNKLGIEESARNMRYAFFGKTAREIGKCAIVTGHTADDNAETILLNLTRGTGAKGLCGIPAKRSNIIRPILQLSRDEILNYALKHGIKYVEDSTNESFDYNRNKIRMFVMPILKEINPSFTDSAATAGALIQADEEYLSEAADTFINKHCAACEPNPNHAIAGDGNGLNFAGAVADGNGGLNCAGAVRVDAKKLADLHSAISGRVVRKLCGGNLSYRHYAEIMKLCKSRNPAAMLVLQKMIIRREYSSIIFNKIPAKNIKVFEPFFPTECEFFQIPEIGLNISCKQIMFSDTINTPLAAFLFKSSEICGKIQCRPRLEGDKIRILGRSVSKSLKKLFIEHRVPKHKRNLIPVISDDAGVLAVYGIARADRAVAREGDMCTLIEFSQIVT